MDHGRCGNDPVDSCQVTENDEPRLPSDPGVAPAASSCDANRPGPTKLAAPPWSSIAVAVQALSRIVPLWPPAVAVAFVNVTVPKFASGSVVHEPRSSQPDGASAIHSAEEASGDELRSVFVKDV